MDQIPISVLCYSDTGVFTTGMNIQYKKIVINITRHKSGFRPVSIIARTNLNLSLVNSTQNVSAYSCLVEVPIHG